MNFYNYSLYTIIKQLKKKIKSLKKHDILEFEVLNPDVITSKYSGEIVYLNSKKYIYRSYKVWNDLAHMLYCKMLTPIPHNEYTVKIRFQKLDMKSSFHMNLKDSEKYGIESLYARINKNEESSFLFYFMQALENINFSNKDGLKFRILNLGINDGSEFDVLKTYLQDNKFNFNDIECIGIDYCKSAIDRAKLKFKDEDNIKLIQHDINRLVEIDNRLSKFDLIITIGTLQSSGLEFKPLFMSIVQKYLKKNGYMIIGFPNCRWIDGEIIYGAKAKNYNFPESSVLIKDVYFCKKYLQQKKFRTMLIGKDYLFLIAIPI